MYEARQNKEKVSRRIDSADGRARQRVKIDNKRILRVQLMPSCTTLQAKKDLTCHTTILYVNKGTGIFSASADGMNDPDDCVVVVNRIKKHPQTKDLKVDQRADNSNQPGQCAEPHSLANALEELEETDKIIEITQGPAIFTHDPCNEALQAQKDRRDGQIQKNKFKNKINKIKKKNTDGEHRTFALDKKKGDTYDPCATCQQWVPKLPEIGKKEKEEYYNDISANEYSAESDRYEKYSSSVVADL